MKYIFFLFLFILFSCEQPVNVYVEDPEQESLVDKENQYTEPEIQEQPEVEDPEPEVEPEPTIAEETITIEYNTYYSIQGIATGRTPDALSVEDGTIYINGKPAQYSESLSGTDMFLCYTLLVDSSDSWLFINENMLNFFDINFKRMSFGEVVTATDIIDRYPEEVYELIAEYGTGEMKLKYL